jgi:cytidylate kinase
MYRALALKALRRNTNLADEEQLNALIESTDIDIIDRGGSVEVRLDGADVAALIRTPEISQLASKISALKAVRQRMAELQRMLGERGSVVAEGRDIGTVIFPGAEVKIYLDASVSERARRRFEELRSAGRQVSLAETLREIEERDKRDSERDLAPLRKAEDAIAIDSSSLSADAVKERVMIEIRRKNCKIN